MASTVLEIIGEDEMKFLVGEMIVLGQNVIDLIDDGLGFAGIDSIAAGGTAFEMTGMLAIVVHELLTEISHRLDDSWIIGV